MLPLIEIGGTPYEMGHQLGAKARKQIRAGLKFYKKNWKTLVNRSWQASLTFISPALKTLPRLLPKTYEELKGMAQGSEIALNDLLVLNFMESLAKPDDRERCTSIFVGSQLTKNHRAFIAHNEDWVGEDTKWMYVVRAHPQGEPSFLTISYNGWLPYYGVNEAGIACVADSQEAKDANPRYGLSQTLVGREAMRCTTMKQAIRRITSLPRADGHTYTMGDSQGKGSVLEVTAASHNVIPLTRYDFFAHANAYQTPRFVKKERSPPKTYSHFRRLRVNELLVNRKNITMNMLFDALADHVNFPESVCRHVGEVSKKKGAENTIASFVIDVTSKTLHVIHGFPCRERPHVFKLK